MQLSLNCDYIFFVNDSGKKEDASKDLNCSYEKIVNFQHLTPNLAWISQNDCLVIPFPPWISTKRNIFVLEKFDRTTCRQLSRLPNSTVRGPQFILMCQLTNNNVLNIKSPIFTLTMENVAAYLSAEIISTKLFKIQKMIRFMGGSLTRDITKSTHFITNMCSSELEFKNAATRNLKIMKEEWVYEMWELSKSGDTSYTSEAFYHKYKVTIPMFHNLVFTSMGIKFKNGVIETIQNNGGVYVERNEIDSLHTKAIDIFLLQSDQRETAEFKSVAKYCKEYLKVEWVLYSKAYGYTPPVESYRIFNRNQFFHSTQIFTTLSTTADFNPDGSQLSAIQSSNENITSTEQKKGTHSSIDNRTYVKTSRSQPISGPNGWRDNEKRRFLLCLRSNSKLFEQEGQVLKEQILQLNAEICGESSVLDPSSTHVICYVPDLSETILLAVASGCWLLHPDYIKHSFLAGHFLNEKHYEWGNLEAIHNLEAQHNLEALHNLSIIWDSQLCQFARASSMSRKRLQLRYEKENKRVGMFSTFRVILHLDENKDAFERIVKAGCGDVVDIDYTKGFNGVTHCYTTKNKIMSDHLKEALAKANVPCVDISRLMQFFFQT